MRRKAWALALATALATTLFATAAVASAGHQTVGVFWHAQQAAVGNTGTVNGASASLVRRDNGVSYRINTASLTPGNAYTLWLVVINNPEACTAEGPCTGQEIIQNVNGDTDSQVLYGKGHIAGASGQVTFAGSISEGPLAGWLPGRSFEDARSADIHLVINDHGPALADFMPGMIKTYRGGCSNTSPFPPFFPATALADGEVGPNICRLAQAAVFETP